MSESIGLPLWAARRWNGTDSWDVYEGDKRIVADLLEEECFQIATAHNTTLNEFVLHRRE